MTHFDSILRRIHATTGTRTQVQLADQLQVKQSSISDAKRRASIPDSWLVTLQRVFGVNPEWILNGDPEPRWLVPADEKGRPLNVTRERERLEQEVRRELDTLGVGELIARLREAVPGVVITVGNAAPESQSDEQARQPQ
jgi:hypothetical protein